MYATLILAALASSAVAAPIARSTQPASWATGYLEEYDVYHTRYLALDCEDQHNSTFFDDCCHPLLATESLSDRLAYCTPNATESTSASQFLATASSTASADEDAATEYVSAATSILAEASASPSAVASAENGFAKAHASSAHTTTSEWVAPSTTTTHTTHKAAATTTSSSASASTSSSSSSSVSGDVMTGGYATYFYQGGNAGECGTVHSDSDKVIAIDAAGWWSDYETNDNSPYCGKYINIKNTNNGKTVTAMVADVCPTCDTNNSLDLSVGAFTAIASESDGMVPIEWSWA